MLSRVRETAAALRLLGFVYYIIFFIGHSYSMLKDDHSFMGGSDDTWFGGLVGMEGTRIMIVLVKHRSVSPG